MIPTRLTLIQRTVQAVRPLAAYLCKSSRVSRVKHPNFSGSTSNLLSLASLSISAETLSRLIRDAVLKAMVTQPGGKR